MSIIHLENGVKTEFLNTRIPVEDKPIYLRLYIEGRRSWFEWSYDGESYEKIGRIFDTTRFSDEYCKYGEFTGTMVGITCADRVLHKKCADFDSFEYKADESRMVEYCKNNCNTEKQASMIQISKPVFLRCRKLFCNIPVT